MSETNEALRNYAHLYTYEPDGRIKSPDGNYLKPWLSNNGYLTFTLVDNGKRYKILVHRFIAYVKYGEAIFCPGIIVRHLDGNCLNNNIDNIAIGNQRDNYMDRTPEARKEHAIIAAKAHKQKAVERIKERDQELLTGIYIFKKTGERVRVTEIHGDLVKVEREIPLEIRKNIYTWFVCTIKQLEKVA